MIKKIISNIAKFALIVSLFYALEYLFHVCFLNGLYATIWYGCALQVIAFILLFRSVGTVSPWVDYIQYRPESGAVIIVREKRLKHTMFITYTPDNAAQMDGDLDVYDFEWMYIPD